MSRKIEIFTSSSRTSEVTETNGKWAITAANGKAIREIAGACESVSVNQMELKVVIEALKFAINAFPVGRTVVVFTSSLYVRNGVTKWLEDWKKNDFITSKKDQVKNKELWLELDSLQSQANIVWDWTKGSTPSATGNTPPKVRKSSAKLEVVA